MLNLYTRRLCLMNMFLHNIGEIDGESAVSPNDSLVADGGNREANQALWRIVITRMSSHPPTRAYVDRRSKEGLSKKEIIRCLKRYVARQVYPHLRGTG